MNGMKLAIAGTVGVLVSALAGLALYLLYDFSVSVECRVGFQYEFGKPSKDGQSLGSLEADEFNRNVRYKKVIDDFKREMFFCSSKAGIVKCCRESAFLGESESRIREILSSVRFEVTGMPSTNFVYECQLVLSSDDGRNIESYARYCMDRFKERLAEENKVLIAKCTTKEFQTMKKAEKKIAELESLSKCGDVTAVKNELRNAHLTVEEMKKKIDKIGEYVLPTNGRRIIYEAAPEISWTVRCKAR